MEEEGVVLSVPRPGTALVKMTRSAACEGCGACGLCHSIEGSPDEMAAEVNDDIGVSPGQRVVLALPARAVLKASLAVYIVPVAVLVVVGILVQDLVSGFLPDKEAQLLSILAGLAGLAVTFFFLRRFFRRGGERSLRPSIISTI